MTSTIERYQKDIQRLVNQGGKLVLAMQRECGKLANVKTDLSEEELKNLPDFSSHYQPWYSEAIALLLQILPERLDDFKAYYAPKTPPKEYTWANYTISDFLRGLTVRLRGETVVGQSGALQPMYQQYNIIAGLANRFASTLYDIKTLLHADLMDDELHAAEELKQEGLPTGRGRDGGGRSGGTPSRGLRTT